MMNTAIVLTFLALLPILLANLLHSTDIRWIQSTFTFVMYSSLGKTSVGALSIHLVKLCVMLKMLGILNLTHLFF